MHSRLSFLVLVRARACFCSVLAEEDEKMKVTDPISFFQPSSNTSIVEERRDYLNTLHNLHTGISSPHFFTHLSPRAHLVQSTTKVRLKKFICEALLFSKSDPGCHIIFCVGEQKWRRPFPCPLCSLLQSKPREWWTDTYVGYLFVWPLVGHMNGFNQRKLSISSSSSGFLPSNKSWEHRWSEEAWASVHVSQQRTREPLVNGTCKF